MGPLSIHIDRKAYPPVADRPELPVLRDVALDIEPGSFVVITGPSGCGKSTMLNVVAGLDDDYEGSVDFGGGDPVLSFMFQTPRLLPWRTVCENIELVMEADDPRLSRIPELLASVGLAEQADVFPERLSLGMQRRAALARAFVLEPDILLMDEPFVSLDEPTARTLREILMTLWRKRPTTVLFVTHDRLEAMALATRIVRVGGQPATVVQDEAVRLTEAERMDRGALETAQAAMFQD